MSGVSSNIYEHDDFAKKPIKNNAQAIKRAIYGWKGCYQMSSLWGTAEKKSFNMVYSCFDSLLNFSSIDIC